MTINDQIQHITDQWTAVDAPMRIDPNHDYDDYYDSDDEIGMTDAMKAALVRGREDGREDKLLTDTLKDFDKEWTHNSKVEEEPPLLPPLDAGNSTTDFYSIIYARTAALDDWATLGTPNQDA